MEIAAAATVQLKLADYDRLFIVYADLLKLIADTAKACSRSRCNICNNSGQAAKDASDLEALREYVSFEKCKHTLERNLLLAEQHLSKYKQGN